MMYYDAVYMHAAMIPQKDTLFPGNGMTVAELVHSIRLLKLRYFLLMIKW